MTTVAYFAYGSNMLVERLRARCPSAARVGVAMAEDHALAWDKVGRDGSGKCGMVEAKHSRVMGVLFEIGLEDRAALDRLEDSTGADPGYRRDDSFAIVLEDGTAVRGTTYLPLAHKRQAGLPVFEWYRALVLAGAGQNRLDAAYVARIEAVAAVADPVPGRAQRHAALAALAAAGFSTMLEAPG